MFPPPFARPPLLMNARGGLPAIRVVSAQTSPVFPRFLYLFGLFLSPESSLFWVRFVVAAVAQCSAVGNVKGQFREFALVLNVMCRRCRDRQSIFANPAVSLAFLAQSACSADYLCAPCLVPRLIVMRISCYCSSSLPTTKRGHTIVGMSPVFSSHLAEFIINAIYRLRQAGIWVAFRLHLGGIRIAFGWHSHSISRSLRL